MLTNYVFLCIAVENCSPERMNFNGGYNCSGSGDTFSCSLNCGVSGKFEFPPSSAYVCSYASGIFMPQPIPQCIFGKNNSFLLYFNYLVL